MIKSKCNDVRWITIEQELKKNTPLTNIPFLGSEKQLSEITSNPLILATYNAWHQLVHSILELDIQLLVNTPLKNNHRMPAPTADGNLQTWVRKGIRSIDDLYSNNVFASFSQLSGFYDLHSHNLFKYLQIRHWIKSQTETFSNKPKETPLETCFLDPKRTTKDLFLVSIKLLLIIHQLMRNVKKNLMGIGPKLHV